MMGLIDWFVRTGERKRAKIREWDSGYNVGFEAAEDEAAAREVDLHMHLGKSEERRITVQHLLNDAKKNLDRLRQKNGQLGAENSRLKRQESEAVDRAMARAEAAEDKLLAIREVLGQELAVCIDIETYDQLGAPKLLWRETCTDLGTGRTWNFDMPDLTPAAARALFIVRRCPGFFRGWHATQSSEYHLGLFKKLGLIEMEDGLPKITPMGRVVEKHQRTRYGAKK